MWKSQVKMNDIAKKLSTDSGRISMYLVLCSQTTAYDFVRGIEFNDQFYFPVIGRSTKGFIAYS